ncbi:glutamate synthase subunit beta [Streptomyces sp. NPDC048330]|uniref:glutamate synthase subunit beta n=1 Tax=Streptomyces sp. NPDC048330 TaxID=3365533 RepID=UPI003714E606
MTDPAGFLRIPRRPAPSRPAGERVGDWDEVHTGQPLLPVVSAQARRCMDCGVPFCHGGCPLGNLIPEWNVYAAHGDWATASERLHATNNFPDFTGRLCPAPCEDACVLALTDDPVTIKNVEQAVADQAWARGFVAPLRPAKPSGRSVAVVGSGPAGLAAAQQLTRAGHAVTVYERADRIGGLLRYGIPDFKMSKERLDWRLAQMEQEGTRFRPGSDVGGPVDAALMKVEFDAVVVATGATLPREMRCEGRQLGGIHHAMEYLTAANRSTASDPVPASLSAQGKDVVIIGGGDTGSDCLGTALRQEARSVVQMDVHPRPDRGRASDEPWPLVHPRVFRMSHAHEEAWARDGCDPRAFSSVAVRFDGDPSGRVRALVLGAVESGGRDPLPGTTRVLPAQLVLLALGFRGPGQDPGLVGPLGLSVGAEGTFARTPDFAALPPAATPPLEEGASPGRAVQAPFGSAAEEASTGVFVAGDAGRGPSLVVWAIAEGRAAAAATDRYLRGATELPSPIRATDRPLV